MDSIDVIVEREPVDRPKAQTKQDEAYFSCCTSKSPADWPSVMLVGMFLSGLVTIIALVVLFLAYVVEPQFNQSLVSYYELDAKIGGFILLSIGATGLFIGGMLTFMGLCKRPKKEPVQTRPITPTIRVVDSSPTLGNRQRY